MGKKSASVEFVALSKHIGDTVEMGSLQKIFRDNWDHKVENWVNLSPEVTDKVEETIKQQILIYTIPVDEEEKKLYYAELKRLINSAWRKSWSNMKHAKNEMRKKNRNSQKGPDEKTIPNEATSSKTTPNEAASSGTYNTRTEIGSFRPW